MGRSWSLLMERSGVVVPLHYLDLVDHCSSLKILHRSSTINTVEDTDKRLIMPTFYTHLLPSAVQSYRVRDFNILFYRKIPREGSLDFCFTAQVCGGAYFSVFYLFVIFYFFDGTCTARTEHTNRTGTGTMTYKHTTVVPSVCVRTPEFTVYVRLHFIRIRSVNYWKHMKYTACDYIWYPQFIIRHTTTLITQCRLLSTVVVS